MRLTRRKRMGLVMTAVLLNLSFALLALKVFPFPRSAVGHKGSLLLTLKTYQHSVRMNDSINATLTLTNVGSEEAELNYRNSHRMDLLLYSLDGKLITYLTKGCGFLQVLSKTRLQPGESKEWQISWDTFAETGVTIPGPYLLQGSVLYFETSKLPILILP